MKHIKTPVHIEMDGDACDIYDIDGIDVVWDCYEPQGREIVTILNAYDDLIAQRDALVEACESVLDELGKGTTSGRGGFSMFENERCQKVLRTTLALVRG